uniref:Transmembrane 9 superfamily member n=1 Tax=Elaeophora elaphi TaxID=1147741 RepID=A0A0R3RH92_9BILA
MTQQNQATINLFITFYVLLFTVLMAATDAYIFGNGKFGTVDYIRFRRPDDIWEPPFRTVLCNNYPIRIQADADPEEVCRSFMNQMKQINYDQ